jgi:hypothetical protein
VSWVWVPEDKYYVLIPRAWDKNKTRLMTRYIIAIVELLQLPEGPAELGIVQLCEELDADMDMFSAVWAHLYSWQRNLIKDIRAEHDRRRQTTRRIDLPRHDGRGVRRPES